MSDRPFELTWTPEGMVARVRLRGSSVLSSPMLNRGTAFTRAEREALGLTGLLPDGVSTIEGQLRRVYAQYLRQPDDLAKSLHLGQVRNRNEVLFYRLLTEHIHEMLPIVYTPTVGTVIERYSLEFGRPRGVYLSVDHPDQVETAFRNYGLGADEVDLIVATDSEGILGIGDWGVGGIAIADGKLAVYTAAAGLHPRRVIPVVLDTGTDNPDLLAEDMYLGSRHPRVRGERYDQLIDAYVSTATRLFPNAMLHWEDFGAANARRILLKYADTCCTFNDDIQGTAAVVLAAALCATRAAGTAMRDQTVVIHGAGTAGIGIADALRQVMIDEGLSPDQATARFYALGSKGLLTSDYPGTLRDFQVPYARTAAEIAAWARDEDGRIGLAEVVTRSRATMLIGTSTQPGAFTEQIVTAMASHAERPIIMPLSNPTSHSEAQAADLIAWTGGRALIATGSPFPPVPYRGVEYQVAQANNALIFPGLGLGVTVSRARRVSDGMLVAAADALAGLADASAPGAAVLPPVTSLRAVSAAVAEAVARAARAEGLSDVPLDGLAERVRAAMWEPGLPRGGGGLTMPWSVRAVPLPDGDRPADLWIDADRMRERRAGARRRAAAGPVRGTRPGRRPCPPLRGTGTGRPEPRGDAGRADRVGSLGGVPGPRHRIAGGLSTTDRSRPRAAAPAGRRALPRPGGPLFPGLAARGGAAAAADRAGPGGAGARREVGEGDRRFPAGRRRHPVRPGRADLLARGSRGDDRRGARGRGAGRRPRHHRRGRATGPGRGGLRSSTAPRSTSPSCG